MKLFKVATLLLVLSSTTAAMARDCVFNESVPINMPKREMWYHPTAPYTEISCEEMLRVIRHNYPEADRSIVKDAEGCHVLGLTVRSTKFMLTGKRDSSFLYDGKILLCKGLTKTQKYAIRVHEQAHLFFGWLDGQNEKMWSLKALLKAAPIGSLPKYNPN